MMLISSYHIIFLFTWLLSIHLLIWCLSEDYLIIISLIFPVSSLHDLLPLSVCVQVYSTVNYTLNTTVHCTAVHTLVAAVSPVVTTPEIGVVGVGGWTNNTLFSGLFCIIILDNVVYIRAHWGCIDMCVCVRGGYLIRGWSLPVLRSGVQTQGVGGQYWWCYSPHIVCR